MYSFLFFKVYTLTVISFFYFCSASHLIFVQDLSTQWFSSRGQTSLSSFSEWKELLLRMLRHFTEDLDLVENHLVVVFLDVLTTTGCCWVACRSEKNGCKNELWQNFEDKAQNVEDKDLVVPELLRLSSRGRKGLVSRPKGCVGRRGHTSALFPLHTWTQCWSLICKTKIYSIKRMRILNEMTVTVMNQHVLSYDNWCIELFW